MLSQVVNLSIADDQLLFRKILKSFLEDQENLRIVIETSDIADLFDKLRRSSVDILLLDISVLKTNSVDTFSALCREFPDIRILLISTNIEFELIEDLFEAGIYGYISKMDEPEELLRAIQVVSQDRIYRSQFFTEALYRDKQNSMKVYKGGLIDPLSEREKKVIQLIWEEKNNKEIADELFLGIRSIEKIRQDMKEKIGVKSTVGLLKYAIDQKIIRIQGTINAAISKTRKNN